MTTANVLLAHYLKTLRLPTFGKEYAQVARQCGEENQRYEEYLQRLSEREVSARERNAIARRIKEAKIVVVKMSRTPLTMAAS